MKQVNVIQFQQCPITAGGAWFPYFERQTVSNGELSSLFQAENFNWIDCFGKVLNLKETRGQAEQAKSPAEPGDF